MGKTQDHSDDVRRVHKSRNGHKKISKQLKIPISTIMAIIKKFKATEDVNNQPGKGRVCTLTPHTVRRIFRMAKESPRITAGELQRLFESWGQKVSKTTIRCHLHHHKLFWRVGRKKPLLSINNKLNPLQCAKCKSDFRWDRVIWSDVTKIKLFGNKHQRWVWRRQKDSHTEKHLIPNVKYGGGSLMLRGCFSSKGPRHLVRIHGIIDSIKYQQILNENLTALSRKLKMGRVWTFQQDNDPKHTSKSTQKLFTDRRIKVFAMAITVPRLKPHRKSVGRAEAEYTSVDLGIWRDTVCRNGLRSRAMCSPT